MRTFLLGLLHVLEAEQFGGLIYWVGDKAIGGKMFALVNPEAGPSGALHTERISFPAGQERFAELMECEGMVPAPYLARIFWVAAERWDVLRDREWEEQMRASHALTFAKLTKKARGLLEGPKGELKKAVVARRKVLAATGESRGRGKD